MLRKLFLPFIFVPLLFISCNAKKSFDITGTWTTTCTSISEVSTDNENPLSPNAVLTVEQNYSFMFNPDSTFEKNISQEFESLVPNTETTVLPDIKNLKSVINNSITIIGTYNISKNLLTIQCSKVVLKDGSIIDYSDYYDINPNIGEEVQESNIEYLSTKKIKLDDLIFSRE